MIPEPVEVAPVIDLMEALKASVAAAKKARRRQPAAKRKAAAQRRQGPGQLVGSERPSEDDFSGGPVRTTTVTPRVPG